MISRPTLFCLLSAGFLFSCPAFAQTGTRCGPDLLKLYGLKIPHAKLIRSETPAHPSQKFCESTYSLPGKYARTTEAMLVRKYGMGKLVYECCGWSPAKGKAGNFRRGHAIADGTFVSYEISMGSEETAEKQWDKIENLYITLTILGV